MAQGQPLGVTVPKTLRTLAVLARHLHAESAPDARLRLAVNAFAELCGTKRASLRLLDDSGQRLTVGARAGKPHHSDDGYLFPLDEGLLAWVIRERATLRLDDAERDPRFLPRGDQQEPIGAFLSVPLLAGETCLGALSATHADAGRFTEGHEAIAELVAAIAAPQLEIARLQRLADFDPLTGILNRRGLQRWLDRGGAPLSVVTFDLDYFKRINDVHGHAIGDAVLIEVGQRLARQCRAGDAVVRLGGEEFALVLRGIPLAIAVQRAEAIRLSVANSLFVIGNCRATLTVSAGVAMQEPGESWEALLARGDRALYLAKAAGRNRLIVAAG